jgi:segregation and condensation protein A
MSNELKIELDQFAGPLDLLLYLVRKEEVEIEALPIARVTEQYLSFLDSLEKVDIDRAGDFLVMAAQLLKLKARALLPAGATPGTIDADVGRGDLVRDLLEYRELRERARLLEQRGDEAARRFGRESPRIIEEMPTLKNVDIWDLVTAFKRLEKELGSLLPERVVAEDELPLHIYVDRLRSLLRAAPVGGAVPFRSLFQGSRGEMVATFLALLELVRLGEARARQSGPFGDIEIASADAAPLAG